MNIKISAVKLKENEKDKQSPYLYDDLVGVVYYVPFVEIGSRVHFFYSDCFHIRLITLPVIKYIIKETTRTHIVETENAFITFVELDYSEKYQIKKLKSSLYMETPLGHRAFKPNPDPNAHLLSNGIHATKIYPSDLPLWFVHGYIYKHFGYISSKNVKYLLYVPDYHFNHLFKDDTLYISYRDEITKNDATGYSGYDYLVTGSVIVPFIDSVEAYSDYDVSDIRVEIEKKKQWYQENYCI